MAPHKERGKSEGMNIQTILSTDDRDWAAGVSGKIADKMKQVVNRSRDKIPYRTDNGVFDDCSSREKIGWWTNGFWGGILWQLFHATGEELYREEALKVETKLDPVLMNYDVMDHDSGFLWLPTAVAHWRVEKNHESENRALLAAANMAGRFNLAGRFIRAWNAFDDRDRRGYAIIDCMMNLPLLYWASRVTEDPRFAQIAMAHADTAMKAFVRDDGSVNHIVNFNINTGEILGPVPGQGMNPDSSWTRGQSWGIYGFTLSFLHTGKKEYRETAERIADYVISAIPESNIVPVDYCQPKDIPWEDSTAAAITACGLIELAKCEDDEAKAEKYLGKALELLKTLDAKRCCWDETRDELLEKCTAAYHDKEHDFTIIYGDYYFIEAIYKLCGTELFIW